MPLPVARLQAPCSSLFDLACELSVKPLPPVQDRFTAYVHASFMQKAFYVPKWEWKSHIQHNCKLDDLWAGFEVAKGYRIGNVTEVNFQDAVGQGGLFWQSHRTVSVIYFRMWAQLISFVSILCNLRSDAGMHVQQQLYEALCSFRTMVRSLGLKILHD